MHRYILTKEEMMGKRKKKHSIRTPCNAKNERNQTGNNQLSSYICLADN